MFVCLFVYLFVFIIEFCMIIYVFLFLFICLFISQLFGFFPGGAATPRNPAILLDRDDFLMRSFCLAHARNGKSHRHFKNFSATLFGARISILKQGSNLQIEIKGFLIS